MLARIKNNEPDLAVDKRIKTIRNQSVTWLWNAYNVVNTMALVKKVHVIDLPCVSVTDDPSKLLVI